MPKYLNIDNGKDYTSRELTGVKRYPTRKKQNGMPDLRR